jgi:hypothetical protein
MQTLSPLTSLHALQIISANTDNCHSVIREIRQCVIDNISHYPQLNVEYVALSSMGNGNMSTHISRLVRKEKERKSDGVNKGTGSGKEPIKMGLDADGEEEEDGLRFRVMEGVRMKDVVGVRIWEKEIWGGRL